MLIDAVNVCGSITQPGQYSLTPTLKEWIKPRLGSQRGMKHDG